MRLLFGLILFCSIAVLGVSYMVFQKFVSKYPEDKICKNVYIGSVDVSGMTEKEAGKVMEERLAQGRQASVTVKVGEKEETVNEKILIPKTDSNHRFVRLLFCMRDGREKIIDDS